ncbi:hypothetical protein [Magnetovibrio blakemorei]|uniref:Formyl transferase N-terminal domain-containing protein n=1 Tax=Magnetovibrio blakemorei TaxID=28181 RepID=A0A1E5QC04_9PROT|nr:hypothetical protein [Magnetovibrio blakemorei]OEJ69560.1 hypothetical protein BEN30_02465 [Magnetovibrio blakemorei]
MTARILEDVVLFGADTARSRAYLSLLLQNGLSPAYCVLLMPHGAPKPSTPIETELFDNITPLSDSARMAGIAVIEVDSDDINAPEVVNALAGCPQNVVIFSAPAGALVKEPLFATGKCFLHVHPGKLPQYRGSTTMYYSLLAEDKICVSALILNAQIDQGPVVGMMEAEVPADRALLDLVFDPVIRARLLVRVLARYWEVGNFQNLPQIENDARTYFIVHPVLKHIAILSRPRDS